MGNEQLAPVKYDPKTGLNEYKLTMPGGVDKTFRVPSVENWLKGRTIDQGFNESQRGYVDRRLQYLYRYFTEDNLPDPSMALDLAASTLPDKEMLRMMRYRAAAVDDPSSWSRMWKLPVFSQIKTATTEWLPAPVRFIKHNTLDWFARNMTGNPNEDFFQLFTYSVARLDDAIAGRPVWHTNEDGSLSALDNDLKTPVSIGDWIKKEGAFAQALTIGSDILTSFAYDPLYGLGKMSAARKAATAGIKGTQAIEEASKGSRLFMTSMDDMRRVGNGQLKWSDWMKGQSLPDIIRATHGRDTRMQSLFGMLDRTKSPFVAKKLLGKMGKTANAEFISYIVKNNKANGGKGALNAFTDMFDTAKHAELKAEFAQGVERAKWVTDELERMPNWAKQAADEFKRTPEGTQLAGDTGWFAQADFGAMGYEDGMALIRRSGELADEASFVKSRLADLNEAMSAQAHITRLPRVGFSTQLRAWTDKRLGHPIYEDFFEKRIGDGMKGIGKGFGRSMRGVGQMTPHPSISVVDDLAHEQFSRWLGEVELTTQATHPLRSALAGQKVKAWTRADSEDLYNRFVKAETPEQRIQVMADAENKLLGDHIGFTAPEIEAIRKTHADEWGRFVTYQNARGMKSTRMLSPGDARMKTPILPAHMVRRLAKVGRRHFKSSEQKLAATQYAIRKTYAIWKSLAVFRPAYMFRVTLLSEQPRLAMAGLPNFITHPILALASTDLPALNKVGRKLIDVKMSIPGFRNMILFGKSNAESVGHLHNLDFVFKEIQKNGGSMAFVGKRRAEAGLGGLKPAEVLPGFDPTIPQAYRYADFPDEVSQKFYREGHLKALNEILGFDDPVARAWVQGAKMDDMKKWASSPEGVQHRANLGIKDEEIGDWLFEHKERFDDWTNGLTQDQKGRIGALTLDDLEGIDPPGLLPSSLWADTLRRPGMVMPKAVVDRLMDRAWSHIIANPSYHLSRSGPLLDNTVSLVEQNLHIANDAAAAASDGLATMTKGARHIDDIRDNEEIAGLWFADEYSEGVAQRLQQDIDTPEQLAAANELKNAMHMADRAGDSQAYYAAKRQLADTSTDEALKRYYAASLNDPKMGQYRDAYAKLALKNPKLQEKTQKILAESGVPEGKVVLWRGHDAGKAPVFGEFINASLDYRTAANFSFDRAWSAAPQSLKDEIYELRGTMTDTRGTLVDLKTRLQGMETMHGPRSAEVRLRMQALKDGITEADKQYQKAVIAHQKKLDQLHSNGAVSRIIVDRKDIAAIGSTAEFEVILPVKKAEPITDMRINELEANIRPDREQILRAMVTGDTSKLSAASKRVLDQSYNGAVKNVKQVVYDLAESARVADLSRFLMPFANAWQEELTRWAQLFWARPQIPVAMANIWRKREQFPFYYRDPRSGEDMYYVPGTAWLTKFATGSGWNPLTKADDGIAMPLGGRLKNLFMLTGGGGFLPGGGPWLQLSANAANKIVHLPPGLMNMVDPYAGRRGIADILIPSAFYRSYNELNADEKSRQRAVMVNAAVAQAWWEADGDPNKIDIDKIEKQARTLAIINAAAGLTVGSGIRAQLPYAIQEMAGYLHFVQVNYPEAAEKLFLEKYGQKAIAFMTNYTRNLTGQPPTKEAEAFFLNDTTSPLAKKYENVFWAVQAEASRGEYDPVAYASQIARGDREYREGDEFLNAAVTQTGWWRYGHLKNAFETVIGNNGWLPGSEEYKMAREAFVQEREKLFAAYPAFQEEWLSSGQHEWQINQQRLFDMIQDEYFQDSELQTVKAAREYFGAQEMMKQAMAAMDVKSLTSKAALPLLQTWNTIVTEIQRRYPDFQFVYSRLNLDNWSGRDDEMPLTRSK